MTKSSARPLKLPSNSAKAKVENKALWNEARSAASADFFTFGYEGRKTPEIVQSLREACVKCVLDIRYNPVSMYRPELSKSNLQSLLEANGIEYLHVREWGVPREIRARAIDTGTRDTIWQWYDDLYCQTVLRAESSSLFEHGLSPRDDVHRVRSNGMS